MTKEYIEQRDGNYYVSGTRVSLDSLIHAFHRGESPETICQNFELLHLDLDAAMSAVEKILLFEMFMVLGGE